MTRPVVITKVTGHIVDRYLAGDLRYLSEIISRGTWEFKPLTPEQLTGLVGQNRCLYAAQPGGLITRIPAEILPTLDRNGVMRGRKTGTISQPYAARVEGLRTMGKIIFQRVRVIPDMEILHGEHGYTLAREHGAVAPLSWTAQVRAQEMNWSTTLPAAAGRTILGRMLRDAIHSHAPSRRRAVKTMTGPDKVGRHILAHNLVVAPAPSILARIKAAGLPVDHMLEKAARRVIQKMERRRGAQIIAVCSTHLRDSSGVRPHLHIRMDSRDSTGKYIRLFDGKGGGGGGGRCILQADIEQQILRTIERSRSGKRE